MRNAKITKMVAVAFLMALVVVMQFVSGMIPPVGGFSISLVLIPVVLGAVLYGPGVGALLGATFGTIVFINCVTGADPGGAMVFQASPVLCFLVVMAKGTLAGLASGFFYKLLKKLNVYVAMLCAAIVCPVVNTGLFICGMFVFFMSTLEAWAGGMNVVYFAIIGLTGINFIVELVVNLALSSAITGIIRYGKGQRRE